MNSLFLLLRLCRYMRRAVVLFAVVPLAAQAQTLSIHDAVRTYSTLANTTVTMSGRAELRITGTGDPISGSIINLDSPDSWLLMTGIAPSQVASTFLSRIRVNGANAVLDGNCRAVQYAQGAVVVPQGQNFAPLEIFETRFFTGRSKPLNSFVAYNNLMLGSSTGAIGSFKLKRGYQVTFAQQESGNGISRNYVAQDGDLEVGVLPTSLENNVHF